MVYLACIFLAPMNASLGVAPPTVGWVLSHHYQENALQTNLRETGLSLESHFTPVTLMSG